MKLSRVNLARAMTVGRHHTAELTADTVGADITADMDARVVWLGDQFIPFEAVNSATKAEPDVPCPECEKAGVVKKLSNMQALGAHRQKAHGWKGAGSND